MFDSFMEKMGEEKARALVSKDDKLMTVQQYRDKFKKQLDKRKYMPYFDSMTEPRTETVEIGMIFVPDKEHVPGGAWPGNYMRYVIKDYSRPRSFTMKGDKLLTTKQLISKELKREKHSLFNLPYRLHKGYYDRLLCFVGGTLCSGSKLTPNMLKAAIKQMTPLEYANWLIKTQKIDICLYATVEKPVLVRFDGIDDGAEERLFGDINSAKFNVFDIALYASHYKRSNAHFKGTD